MKYIKKFENTDWNEVLHNATWSNERINRKGSDIFYRMDFDKIKLAIENGADVDSCGTLSWAVSMNNFEIVKYLLEHGADVNTKNISSSNSGEWTPLMLASDDGYVDIAKILIDYGADPVMGNFQDTTSLDILTPRSCISTAAFGYEAVNGNIKNKRDKIFRYIKQKGLLLKFMIKNLQNDEYHYVDAVKKLSRYIKFLNPKEKEKFNELVELQTNINKYNL
jgi:ankyrin repeat protein